MFAFLLIVVGALAVAYFLFAQNQKGQSIMSKRVMVRERCRSEQDCKQILVLVVTNGSPHGCARTLFELFDKARCPQRLHVAVHDTVRNGAYSPNIVQLYAAIAKESSCIGKRFSERISYYRIPEHQSRGRTVALAQILQTAYKGQSYVCTVGDVVELAPQWDHTAIHQLHATRDPRAILTGPLAVSVETSRQAHTVSVEDGDTTQMAPRFPVFDSFSWLGLPTLGGHIFAKPKPQIPTSSLFWVADFSFADASAFAPSGQASNFDARLLNASSGEEFWQSARLWTQGWNFYAPTVPIACVPREASIDATQATQI